MQLFANALIAGSLAALIAGGLALVYGVLGVFNLALGQTVLLGGYGTWWLREELQWALVPSVVGGLLLGVFFSWLTFLVAVKPFYKRHRFLPLVSTIAFGMMLDALILLTFQEHPRQILTGFDTVLDIGGARLSIAQIALIVLTIAILSVFAFVLHSTAFGRRIRAVSQHDLSALSLGIQAPALHLALFIGSGLLASLGGIFIGIDQNLTPTLAFPLTIKAYAAVIAGGKGHLWGTIIAAYLIALLEQLAVGIHWFGAFYIPAGYQAAVPLLFIIAFLLIKPTGLFRSAARTA